MLVIAYGQYSIVATPLTDIENHFSVSIGFVHEILLDQVVLHPQAYSCALNCVSSIIHLPDAKLWSQEIAVKGEKPARQSRWSRLVALYIL